MGELVGRGEATGGLVFTCIACAPFTGTTRATGAECAHTGTCGVGIITTSRRGGSGAVIDVALDAICIAAVSCGDGQALAG